MSGRWMPLLVSFVSLACFAKPLFISKLRLAQRAWLAFLEADLEAQFAYPEDEGKLHCWGSMYPMSYLFRKAELTRERTRHLERFLNEGHGE